MLVDEKIIALQKFTKHKITYSDIADVLNITTSAVSNRVIRKQQLKDYEELLLDAAFLKGKYKERTQNNTIEDSIIKIPYWDSLPNELKIPDFTCVTAESNVIKSHWYLNPDDLCIVPMVGDKMTNYWYPIRSGDILIVDTSQDEILGNGVYFATSQNNTRFWIREMQRLINQDIEIKGYSPSGSTIKTFGQKELNDVDFKIIGKVIKNMSFRL